MKTSSDNSSAATSRAPFAPATKLEHVPFVFYEIFDLATRGKSGEIVPLIKSVIEITQTEPDGLAKLPLIVQSQEER